MKRLSNYFFKVIAVAYVPTLFILSFFPQSTDGGTSYALNLLFFFLYSFPFYCVFLEIGATIGSIMDERAKTVAEKVIHTIRLVLSVGILLTLINLSDYLYLALTMTVAWIVFRILGAILFRSSRQKDEIIQTKQFWISVVAVILVVCGGLLILRFAIDSQNKPDPLVGGGKSKITGSIAYFYGDDENAIDTFSTHSTKEKEIKLSKEKTYKIELRPSFVGSKQAVYNGNCAMFYFSDDCCEITYVGEDDDQPVYELKIKTDSDFDLTISVDGYTQTIKIRVL